MDDRDKPPHVKVRLHSNGEDVETPWAYDLGPAENGRGRLLRIDNVPFFHAKPTWGDVIIATPDDDGYLTWDREGVPYEEVFDKIVEDGGRWGMIVDYTPHQDVDVNAEFQALCNAGKANDLVTEGAFGSRDGRPGRLYLAVPEDATVEGVMAILEGSGARMELTLVHPRDDEEDED